MDKASEKIHQLINNKTTVNEGKIIAYINNHSDYNDVRFTDSLLGKYIQGETCEISETSGLLLKEISSVFNSFAISHAQYQRILDSDNYTTMSNSLEQ